MFEMLTRHGRGVLIAGALVLAAGVGLRLAYLDVPPIEFHPTRQYRAALIARALSDTALQALSPAEQVAARQMGGAQDVLEPPVMERVAVAGYALLGREDLRVPRLVSIAAWLLAAVSAVWMVAQAGGPGWAMIVSLAVALLLPYGIDASRAFMPDPLMTGLSMLTLALMLRQGEHHSWTARLPVVLVLGAACYVKPMAALLCLPPLVLLDLSRAGWRGLWRAGITSAMAVGPTAAYYVSIAAATGSVNGNPFFPQLWVQTSFWTDWLVILDRVIGLQALLVSLAALAVATGPVRWLLGGAWLGYLLLGLTFSHHIHTHDYYSLPVMPLAAASIGIAVPGLLRGLSDARRPLAAFALVAALVGWTLRTPEGQHPWGNIRLARLTAADYTRIGTLVGHSTRVATLEGAYGFPLAYHGRMGASQLSLSIDRAVAALQGQTLPSAMDQMRGLGAEYFVGTVFPEVAAQPELATWLTTEARLVEQAGPASRWRYVVYDVAGR